jgi:isopentenyl-diphosphate delta-isomerase
MLRLLQVKDELVVNNTYPDVIVAEVMRQLQSESSLPETGLATLIFATPLDPETFRVDLALEQTLILVDNNDRILGYAPRSVCHTGKGKRHRAFVVALYNSKGEILLQRRKHALFTNMWDLTGASHPLRLSRRNEPYAEAAARCVRDEFGIRGVSLRKLGAFNYFAPHGKKCENEHCALIVGKYDAKVRPNSKVAYGFKWEGLTETLHEIQQKPNSFVLWARLGAKLLRKHRVGKYLVKVNAANKT